MKIGLWLKAASICIALLPNLSYAESDGWQYRLTPYVWIPSLYADLDIGLNPPVESDTSLLEVLDFAFLLTGEARKGQWGIIGEYNYLALSQDSTYYDGTFSVDSELDGVMLGVALAYRLFEDDRASVDWFGGLRYWSLEASIDFKRLPGASKSKHWTDPILGIRGSREIGENYFVNALAEIGGFGVGSDLQWEIVARAGYHFSDTVSAALGYRHLDLDFDDDGLVIDAEMTGPFFAIDLNW
ncbi:MAG: hypothetical protein QNJ78_13645 [Gammaproteobacteria bacterium]|nr:hypothetical protein [Gammaproteobacteria bacterium]